MGVACFCADRSNPLVWSHYGNNCRGITFGFEISTATLDCTAKLPFPVSYYPAPEIFNSDQGSQFTSEAFTGVLKAHGVRISMDGKGRCMDNIFVERLWRSVKYEEVYLKDYETVDELRKSLARYFHFYNEERPHQAFGEATPIEIYQQGLRCSEAA